MGNEYGEIGKQKSFEASNITLLTLSVAASAINYIFQIMLGRCLTVEKFGVINSILSFISVLTIPGTIMAVIVVKECASIDSKMKTALEDSLCVLVKVSFWIILFLSFLQVISTGLLKKVIKVDRIEYIVLGIGIAAVSIYVQILYSILQGRSQFFELGVQSLLTAFSKLVLSGIFVMLGGDIHSILLAYLLAEIFTLIYCAHNVKFNLKRIATHNVSFHGEWIKWKDSITVISLCQIVIMLLSNGDVLLVKVFFSDEITGLYSSAITLARIPIFVALSISNVLLPTVVVQKKKGKQTKIFLYKALVYSGMVCIIMFILLQTMGQEIIQFLYGQQYVASVKYFSEISLYVLAIVILTVTMNYAISVDKVLFFSKATLSGMMLALLIGLLFSYELELMIMSISVVLIGTALVNVTYILMQEKKESALCLIKK